MSLLRSIPFKGEGQQLLFLILRTNQFVLGNVLWREVDG